MVRSEALQSWLYICGRLTYLLPRARYAGGDLTIQDIERILHYMVIESILKEQFEVQQPYGTVIAYMQVRPRHFAQWKRPHSTAAANSSLSLRASTDRTECRASRERPKD